VKTTIIKSLALIVITTFFFATITAQRGAVKTDSRILYHDGPVMLGTSNIYFIWYGNWTGSETDNILIDFSSYIGATPYFNINTTYPDLNGVAPSGVVVYAGGVYDAYSHGPTLTVEDVQDVVADQIAAYGLPLDTSGIFLVVGSADVTDVRPDGSTFCTPGTAPHHGLGEFNGAKFKYGYLGDAARCPTSAGGQFVAPNGSLLPTPNGNFSADAMASTMARLLNVIVTNPFGVDALYGGWYDRYGFENADKCAGKFGTTYIAPNGGRANMRLGQRHYLIQQNWVNDRKGRCALSYP
jgi:hypothetical protein